MSRVCLSLIACCVVTCWSWGEPPVSADLDRLFTTGTAGAFDWSCLVRDTASGEPLYALHAETPRIPASNQKLVVTAAALLALGPDYRPFTRYYADGPILDGTLHGNLIVTGYGAIAFTTRHLDLDPAAAQLKLDDQLSRFAFQLRQAGITRIRGRLIADSSAYTPATINSHYPCAGPLTFNENTLDIWVKDGQVLTVPDHLVGFEIIPKTSGVDQSQAPGTDIITVNTSRVSDDYWRLDTVPTSTYFTAHLTRALSMRGIRIDERDLPSGRRQLLVEQPGLSIAELLGGLNTASDNLRAELLYLHLAWKIGGQASYELGPDAFAQVFREHEWELPSMLAADGSGLSRQNRLSAHDMVDLLQRLHGSPHGELVAGSLAVAGTSGTLKKRLTSPAVKGHLRAKTGTLSGVKALSGYLDTASGRRLTFSFLANDVTHPGDWWQVIEAAAAHLRATY